jgi:protein SCO1
VKYRILVAICLPLFAAAPAFAQYYPAAKPELEERVPKVEVEPRLGATLPLELPFVDETGTEIELRKYFGLRPVILAMVYYECPMLCTMVLNGLMRGLKPLSMNPGQDFEVVVISIDPRETPTLAARKKKAQLAMYARPARNAGWHFLTGREQEIEKVARAVGLGYVYQPDLEQYAHAAAVTVLTPEGKVARYLYGIDYAPKDLKLSVLDASQEKVASVADRMLMLCFHYDPISGKYGFAIMNAIRAGGLLTMLGIGGAIFAMVRRERRKRVEG